WLSVASPRSGTVAPGSQVQVPVTINAAGFAAGEVHSGAINILHNDSQAAIPWIVPVTLTVTGASPPVVITNNATDITPISATLNGRLGSLGAYSSANVSFEWGTASGNLTRLTTPQVMTSTGNFSSAISGLSGNTTYYFRAKATSNVTVFGDVLSFRSVATGVYVFINAPDRVVPGSNFTATVDISQVDSFDAANYAVSFNPAVLRLDDVTAGQIGAGGNFTSIPVDIWNAAANGTFNVIQNVPGLSGVNGSGYLAVLHFRALGSLGSSSNITLSNGVLSSNLAEGIPAAWIGDYVQVSLQAGDANGDGAINAIDITKVERIIAHLDPSTLGADANQDGQVNALDITKVERLIAGLDGPAPTELSTIQSAVRTMMVAQGFTSLSGETNAAGSGTGNVS
ncbi:MAG: cohesin domain-containing protein, partial [Chloroflexota bacterium]